MSHSQDRIENSMARSLLQAGLKRRKSRGEVRHGRLTSCRRSWRHTRPWPYLLHLYCIISKGMVERHSHLAVAGGSGGAALALGRHRHTGHRRQALVVVGLACNGHTGGGTTECACGLERCQPILSVWTYYITSGCKAMNVADSYARTVAAADRVVDLGAGLGLHLALALRYQHTPIHTKHTHMSS